MANQLQIDNYQLVIEPKGIRITRLDPDSGVGASPILAFTLTEPGQAPIPITIKRLVPAGSLAADFHGFTTDHVALDGRLTLNPEVGGFDVTACLVNESEEMQVRLAAQLDFPTEADPRWIIPGLFYANNRPAGCNRVYPTYSHLNRDLRRLITASWAFRSDRAATPMVGVWTFGVFAFIAAPPVFGRTPESPAGVGMTGLYIASEEGEPTIAVEFPYREVPLKFSYCHEDRNDPQETFVMLPKGTPLNIDLCFGLAKPDLHLYAKALRYLYQRAPEEDKATGEVPPSAAEHYAHIGLLRWHYDHENKAIYEHATFDRHFARRGHQFERTHMHTGWLSGALPAYTLLWAGRESDHLDSIAAGAGVLNRITSELAPCGTLFPVWTRDQGWSCSYGPDEGSAHSRTIAEAVLFLLRATALELKYAANHSQWVSAAMSSLTYAMGAQNETGAFPAYYDLTTGRPITFDGCAGMAWIAPMALANSLLQKPHFRDVAIRAGEYYAQFVQNGFLYGSVEDQALTPTCDDCHWALIVYVALYEMDRDARWLDLACKAADLALTWRFSYNVEFSPSSMLHRYGFRTRGGDIGSVAAPTTGPLGLLCHREMLKLAAYTGDDYYRQRAEDARRFATQLVATEDGHFNARLGMVAGQLFHTDWWQPKGMVLTLSNAMSAALVKHTELVHRQLNIGRETVEWARKSGEMVSVAPVMYSDVLEQDSGDSGDSLISKSATRLLAMRQERTATHDAAPAAGHSVVPVGEGPSERPSLPTIQSPEQGVRPFTSGTFPLPDLERQEPVPYPRVKVPETPTPEAEPEEDPKKTKGDDIEIKYKIF